MAGNGAFKFSKGLAETWDLLVTTIVRLFEADVIVIFKGYRQSMMTIPG